MLVTMRWRRAAKTIHRNSLLQRIISNILLFHHSAGIHDICHLCNRFLSEERDVTDDGHCVHMNIDDITTCWSTTDGIGRTGVHGTLVRSIV